MSRFSRAILFSGVVFAALYYYPDNYWRSVWWDKWFILMAGMTLFVAAKIGERRHWSAGLFVAYILCSALWAFGWRSSYGSSDMDFILSIGKISAYAYASILVTTLTLFFMSYKEFKLAETIFAALCLGDSLVIITQAFMGIEARARGGFFGNPSMSGCFIAMTYPVLVFQPRELARDLKLVMGLKRAAFVLLPCVAVCLTGASQPVGVLVAVAAANALPAWWRNFGRHQDDKWARLVVIIACTVAFIPVIVHFTSWKNPGEVFTDSGRFVIWKLVLTDWWRYGHVWLGQGTGLSQVLVPTLQSQHLLASHANFAQVDWWLWFHSDWLQMLFENGVVGFVIGATMYGFALVKSARQSDWLFASVVGVGVTALANFPAHFPLHAFFAGLVLAESFEPNIMPDLKAYNRRQRERFGL